VGHPGENRTSNPGMNLNIVSQSSMALSFIKTLAAVGKEKGEAGQKSAWRKCRATERATDLREARFSLMSEAELGAVQVDRS
jgi:hypothetical protein